MEHPKLCHLPPVPNNGHQDAPDVPVRRRSRQTLCRLQRTLHHLREQALHVRVWGHMLRADPPRHPRGLLRRLGQEQGAAEGQAEIRPGASFHAHQPLQEGDRGPGDADASACGGLWYERGGPAQQHRQALRGIRSAGRGQCDRWTALQSGAQLQRREHQPHLDEAAPRVDAGQEGGIHGPGGAQAGGAAGFEGSHHVHRRGAHSRPHRGAAPDSGGLQLAEDRGGLPEECHQRPS
mmetsp:Transcript_7152/g.17770  ORF Transcript_7152/g.17770 Transcript_7152/m.17770 type:complete len:236 (+) Transcript_7152:570-1277(+)